MTEKVETNVRLTPKKIYLQPPLPTYQPVFPSDYTACPCQWYILPLAYQ